LPPTSKYQYSNDIICRAVKNENFPEIFRKLDFSQPFFRSSKQLIQAQIICYNKKLTECICIQQELILRKNSGRIQKGGSHGAHYFPHRRQFSIFKLDGG